MSEENSQNKEAQFISKRQYSRVSLFDPIRLITSEYTFEEYMGNISKTGCMILGIKELEIGHNAEVAIKCPEKGYVNFKGTVRRCQEKKRL